MAHLPTRGMRSGQIVTGDSHRRYGTDTLKLAVTVIHRKKGFPGICPVDAPWGKYLDFFRLRPYSMQFVQWTNYQGPPSIVYDVNELGAWVILGFFL